MSRQIPCHIQELAAEKGCTPSQLALAWVLAQGQDVVPIPGTRRVKYLEDNLSAVNVTLSAEELGRIDAIFQAGAAAGDRYPDMSTLNR